MDDRPVTRGYALTSLFCIGALGCGSQGGQDGETSTTGYPMTGTGTGTESGSSSSETDAGMDTDMEGSTSAGPGSPCSWRGNICGEFSICDCSCDYSYDCCECEAAECTEDEHCGEGEFCDVYVSGHSAIAECIPFDCVGAEPLSLYGAVDPNFSVDVVCVSDLYIDTTDLTDLQALSSLKYVVNDVYIHSNQLLTTLEGGPALTSIGGQLQIGYNPTLTDISALSSLQSIGDGYVVCNEQLQTVDIEAVLAQIPEQGLIEVVGNGADGPC